VGGRSRDPVQGTAHLPPTCTSSPLSRAGASSALAGAPDEQRLT
jgi:hypothetical protein